MSENSSSVFVGIWVNHSKGSVIGLTLTLPPHYGNILISVLALLIGWAGSHFWGVTSFALHQFRGTTTKRDALYHQQQVVLRSRLSDTATLYRLWELAWAWKSNTRASFRRTFVLALIVFVNISAFLTAGAFSSRVTSTDGEVLLRGYCGLFDHRTPKLFMGWSDEDWSYVDALFFSSYNGYRRCAAYTRACYSGAFKDSDVTVCNTFTVQAIMSKVDRAAACPYQSGSCPFGAIEIDSGMINSDKHLGINAPRKDQVDVRKIFTCAPIRAEADYSTGWTNESRPSREYFVPDSLPGDLYKYYNIGPSLLFGSYGFTISNYTYVASNASVILAEQAYTINHFASFPQRLNESTFSPLPEFQRQDADVTLLFLGKSISYTGPVLDPWFAAQTPGAKLLGANVAWNPNETNSAIVCTEQYQFCNTTHCSTPSGLYKFTDQAPPPDVEFNTNQLASYRLLWTFLYYMRLDFTLRILRHEILLANQHVYGGFRMSSALPETQWQTEIENMFNVSMAGLQLNALGYAAHENPEARPGIHLHEFVVQPSTKEEKYICKNQKIRSSNYISFNVLGLAIASSISLIIILLNLSLPTFVAWLQMKWHRGNVARMSWIEDDILQMQRIALQGKGVGPWQGKMDAVPVTIEYGMEIPRIEDEDPEFWHSNEMFQPLTSLSGDGWNSSPSLPQGMRSFF
ncbi:hypothetical protein B0O99DRAFT_743763 [Bisporella sp. PMI_857]|nr:hypothetical protein B0O99DRAFT_743763 [Bisporella sp. PMI_857]